MRLAYALLTSMAALAQLKVGHSHLGEPFNEGPRQKPWEIPGTGTVNFPITHKNPETQKWFNQGIALMHSFWYYEAERAFRWCQKLEPDNPMVWWGLARSQAGGPRGAEFQKEAMKRKASASERERLYIEADEPAPFSETRDGKHGRQIMERLVMKYPNDIEAKAHLALMMIGEDRVGTELLIREILKAEPNHPGAHHYRIHNWDGKDPEFALESCRRYGDIAFGIGHALHMPGHVYAGAGMWHEAAISMDAATRAEKRYMADRQVLPLDVWNYPHNKNYLGYIQAQMGMERAAINAGKQLMAAPRLTKDWIFKEVFPPHLQAQVLLSRTYVRFERWKTLLDASQFEWDDKMIGNKVQKAYLEALAHTGLKDLDKARKSFEELEKLDKDVKEKKHFFLDTGYPVMVREVKAKLLLANGKTLEGLAELGEAAQAWAKFADDQDDPPFYPSNLYNDLGRAYLNAKSPALAAPAFEKSLTIVRNDAWALGGLAEAWVALGDRGKANEYYARLQHVWAKADGPLPAMQLGLDAKAKDVSPGSQRDYTKTTLEQFGPDKWEPFLAPKLSALDSAKKRVTLDEYKGRNVVLIFYLGQECAHCMEQLQQASKRKEDFDKHNAVVLAVSSNKPEDNADAQKLKPMSLRLLSDERWENAKRFLSYDDFENLEIHSTIFIDAKGRIRWVQRGGDPFTDFDGLLKEIERVNRAGE